MANNERLKEKRYVGVRETVIYGVANGGQVIGYNMVRMQLTFFLVTVFGIPSTAVATMITVMGIWDALNDPMMGTLVDKTRTNLGKLRPYLLFVPIPLGIATVVFFGGAEFLAGVQSTTLKIVYMCVTYFIWEFFYTIGDIPFWGLSAAISPNPVDRSNAITSARFLSGIIGGLATPVISLLIDLSNKGCRNQYAPALPCHGNCRWHCRHGTLLAFRHLLPRARGSEFRRAEGSRLLQTRRKNKPLLLIVCSNILATVGGVTDTFAQYFYIFSLGAASWGTIIGIPGVISGFLTYLLLPALERRWTSKQIVVRTTGSLTRRYDHLPNRHEILSQPGGHCPAAYDSGHHLQLADEHKHGRPHKDDRRHCRLHGVEDGRKKRGHGVLAADLHQQAHGLALHGYRNGHNPGHRPCHRSARGQLASAC